jgi:predicted phage terminase large subunit-like protein
MAGTMSPVDQQQLLTAILRSDFPSFLRKCFHTLSPGQSYVEGWPTLAMAHQLERVRRGEIKRLIINTPPGSLKSTTCSVAFPAFILGHDPSRRIICVSYSTDLARKLSNDHRAILESDWYREAFPGTRIGRFKDSETEVELTRRGFRLATSIGGTLTGRGGEIVIIDDPLKPVDALSETKRAAANQWFLNTLLSRLDDKRTGAIVIVMQRLHMDDLTGFVLGANGDEWTVLRLPAIAEGHETIPLPKGFRHDRRLGDVLWPSREPSAVLENLRRQLGSDVFSAQYQQSPVPPGGAMIKRHWIMRYVKLPTNEGWMIVQSWDTAAKGGPENDWSVCTTWMRVGAAHWYLLDVWRGRINYPALKTKVIELAKEWRAQQVLVEESGTAIGLIEELNCEVSGLTAVKPTNSKEARMSIASAKFEAGQVFLPEQASWLAELEAELFSFPGSRHDDQVDSISQVLQHEDTLGIWYKLAS